MTGLKENLLIYRPEHYYQKECNTRSGKKENMKEQVKGSHLGTVTVIRMSRTGGGRDYIHFLHKPSPYANTTCIGHVLAGVIPHRYFF